MATKDTGGQQKASRKDEDVEATTDQTEVSEDLKERHEKLEEDVETILDEIDGLLEENAEEFVRSFVQKGGE